MNEHMAPDNTPTLLPLGAGEKAVRSCGRRESPALLNFEPNSHPPAKRGEEGKGVTIYEEKEMNGNAESRNELEEALDGWLLIGRAASRTGGFVLLTWYLLCVLVKWAATAALALFLVLIVYIVIGGAMDARACDDSPRLEFQDRFEMRRQTFEMQRLNNILRRAEINRNRGDVRFKTLLRRAGPYRLMPPR